MMEELSLHILDIAENGINAGANCVEIEVDIEKSKDLMTIKVRDNGKGMDSETLDKIRDPFFTTRTTRKVGLGVSFLDELAELTGGRLDIDSTPGIGTTVRLELPISHPDRPPLGDIISTLITLSMINTEVRITYVEKRDDKVWSFDSDQIKDFLTDYSLLGKIKEILYNSYKDFIGGELI